MFKSARSRLRAAVFACAAALGLGAYAADYTGTGYEPWSYSAGCVVWRATSGQVFHTSTIADVAADGTIGSTYDLDTAGHPWKAFASNGGSNYTAPGLTLVFDEAGYNGSSDAQFAPLSFGGLWVKVLQADDTPYCITDSKTDNTDRTVELGAAGASTYFKFEKSFTFDRNSPTTVKGTATVDIDSGATFTINARANKGAVVESGNTLVLAGSGTLAVTGGLTIGGTLDISAASVPTISGDVTLSAGCTIVLPASAELNTAISIPVATTVTAGSIIWAKIGANDTVRVVPTVESGAITYLDTNVEFTYYSTDEYPTTIPDDGCIYNFVGGESANAATTFAGVTVNGILKTRGYVKLTDFTLNVGGTHEVVSETTTVTAAWNSTDNYGYVSGNITIDAGATYAVTQTDTINWANSGVQKINIYGTLALGTHRWSIMGVDHCVFNLYPGARITGTGDANGLLDLFATTSKLNCYAGSAGGDIYVEGLLKTRNANTPIWIAANTTLHLQGGLTGGGIAKSGAGTLALSGTIASTVANSSVTDGTFAFVDATGTALPLTVNANKSVTVSASSGVTIPLNVTMAGGASITVSGEGTVNGTVTMNALPGTTTDLTAASWAGTVSLAALSNPANVSVLTKLGSANSTLVLKGISSSAYIAASGNTTYTIACPIRLDGAVVIDNGSSGSTINLGKIFGTGNLTIAEWNGCSSIRYNLNAVDIDNYSGTLTLANNNLRTAGGTMTIGIGNLIKASAAVGSVVLPITTTAVDNTTGTIAYNFASGALNGTTTNLCYDTVSEVSGIFIAAAKIGTTGYATVQNAIDALGSDPTDAQLATVSVADANATIPDGYKVENGVISKDVVPTVTITVPTVENASVVVSDGTTTYTPTTEGGTTYSVPAGANITATYTATEGYELEGTSSYVLTNVAEGDAVTLDGTTQAAQYVASMTVNDVTTKYTTLQAAINAITIRGQRVYLLANEQSGATIPNGTYKFFIIPGEFEYGTVAFPAGDYVTSVTQTEVVVSVGSTDKIPAYEYSCAPAEIIVVAGGVRSLYVMNDVNMALAAATAGGAGSTVKFVGDGGGSPYQQFMESAGFEYDSVEDIYTLAAEPVAAVYNGEVLINNYATLAEAVAAAEAGQTVKLLSDVTLDASLAIPAGKSLTLNLNGYTLTGPSGKNYAIANSGNITLTGGTITGYGVARNVADGATITVTDGTYTATGANGFINLTDTVGCAVTINGGTFTAQEAVVATGRSKNSSITVNGGTLTSIDNAVLMDNGSSGYTGNTITVTEGTLNGGITTAGYVACGIYCANDTTVNVTGGTFNITGGCGILARAGKVSVSGTTVINTTGTATGKVGDSRVVVPCAPIVYDSAANYPGYDETTTEFAVSGGTFTADGQDVDCIVQVADEGDATSIAVSGGTFSNAVAEEFCAEGFEPKDNDNGTYGVRVDKGWIYEDAGFPGYTGSWNKEISYDETTHKAAIEDGATYTANKPSAGQLVTINLALSFDAANSDDDVPEGAKAAVRLGEGDTEGTYVFQLYTTNELGSAAWLNATASGVTPAVETDYAFTFVLDMTNKTFTATVDGVALTVDGAETLGFASANASDTVQSIEFTGSGKVTSITGSYEDITVPEGFVADETIGNVTLTAAQAEWLNGQGNYDALAVKIATMTEAAFNNAYLLNLDVTTDFSYEFKVTDVEVGDAAVTVTVSLTRTGALAENVAENEVAKPIVGTLKLKGTAALGTEFTVLGETAVEFDANAKFGDGAEETTVTVDTIKTDAKFYLPVIE